MLNLGTVKPGSTIRIPFSSFDKDDGSSITMTNFAVGDILIYKDGSTTERASTSGFTATTDFDSKTGKHVAIIDLSDNTTADFYAAGSEYLVAIDAVTIDGVTTGGWIARFTIGYSNANLDTTIATLSSQTSFTLTSGPAEDDALNGHWAIIHDQASAVQRATVLILDYTGSTKTVTLVAGATFTVTAKDNISVMDLAPIQPTVLGRTLDVSAGGEAGVDWANVGSPTTTLNLSGTSTKAVEPTVAGRTLDVSAGGEAGLDWANIGSPTTAQNLSGTSTKALEPTTAGRTLDVTATGEAGIDWANIGAPTTTVNLSGTTIKTATDIATAVTAVQADTDDIQTRLPAALVGGRMDSNMQATGTAVITATSIAADAIGASELAADAAAEIASAVRTELTTELGRVDVAVSTRASQTSLDTVDDYVDTEVAAIKAKTDQLVFTVANQVDVNVVDWKGATAPAMTGDAFARLGAPAGASVSADIAAVKSDTGAIKAKTDNLPSDPADASDIAAAFSTVNSNLATVAGYVDTEVAAIKAVTDKLDTTLQATSDGYAFTGNALENAPTGGSTPPTAAEIADAVWDEATSGHTAGGSFGKLVEDTASYIDTEVAAIKAKTDNLPADPADASDIAAAFAAVPAAVWQRILDGTYTAEEIMRVIAAEAAGKTSGMESLAPVFRNLADTKDVITGEQDSAGNRTAVTVDAT